MSYKLLSEPIRKYIRDKRWESLRPIQAAAISKIITTDNNYILASRTASGKTEAAFLPILSKADFNRIGVQVLYISPLIALINDQFFRIEDLCKDLEIKVTKWHAEAKKSLKTNLIKNPNGIVLITPESLEAMFVNAPYNISTLFGNLNYIVIDEIHSFLGVDRGLQLMSLLSRIQQVNKSQIITIGLSATIGDENYIEAKRLTGNISETKVLLDRTKKETEAKFKYFKNSTAELSLDLLKDLYKETSSNKVLVFPNSRGRTEEVAVNLRKISDKVNGHKYYYSHHSSVDKEIRESIERFAKSNERFNFCISCTSTLELGIDIGTVDKIVQIDSTHSVSSLVQRIGRSGRRDGEKSIVNIYATDKWSLLQSLACWQLYKDGFLEPIKTAEKHYDILLHQLLSIVKQLSGCSKTDLIKRLKNNFAFIAIEEQKINAIIEEAIKSDYLEIIQREIILGIEGENIVNSREFYSVFKTEPSFKVIFSGKKIGDIPFSTQVKIDENILLAAKIWKIKDIDLKGRKIIVIPARDGKKPMFFGGGGNIHSRIREEMLQILKSNEEYSELDESSNSILEKLRYDFKEFQISNFKYDKPVIQKEGKLVIYTFTGTKINKSLHFLLSLAGHEISLNDHDSTLELYIGISDFTDLVAEVNKAYRAIDEHLQLALEENESLLGFSKWGEFLPIKYKIEIVKERYFDFETAIELLNNIELIES
ncbi:DEAD/DEAH box helicase [Draconibacterium sediminis]|uniref:DEAD/DEAH box helicase n=1 Tax=Draconibacterium sediminis TaxID=1544798 RepID=A0A0D8J8Z2_9BACT|nr:DEAD/DEAH box helicase [Draconibacterium sediminis]KJF43465.1 DEAD/DEAH box helicase [Draconibacterium sediminis]